MGGSHHHQPSEIPRQLTSEEMNEHKIPLGARDRCAALVIPLNKCRIDNWFLPWKCEHERHAYEKCEYDEYLERVEKQKAIYAAAKNNQ